MRWPTFQSSDILLCRTNFLDFFEQFLLFNGYNAKASLHLLEVPLCDSLKNRNMEIRKEKDLNNLLKGYNMLLYFAGSMIMIEPTEECIVDFWTDGILKTLPVTSMNKRFVCAAAELRKSCEIKTECISILRHDYHRLFGDLKLATPIESISHKNEDYKTISHTQNVTEFYNSYGWKSKFKSIIPDDHLGVELLFLTILIEKYITLDDEACHREMRKEVKRFIDDHLLSWIEGWNNLVQENAQTHCYKGISTLILATVEDLNEIFT